ncbi:MAG: HIT domain-containing protein [Jatrophihabitans sp.]|nr:MAG: HIT domain-containing protein [Jatrophihabitans sp.]
MADDCVFCKIVNGDLPATRIREDEATVSFADLDPQAPVHILVVPRTHLRDLTEVGAHPEVAVALTRGIRALAEQERLTDFRTVFNTGAGAQQTVFHVHAHVLAGRPFSWPPG